MPHGREFGMLKNKNEFISFSFFHFGVVFLPNNIDFGLFSFPMFHFWVVFTNNWIQKRFQILVL
jgi:hypothetical protein